MHHKKAQNLKTCQIYTYDVEAVSPFNPTNSNVRREKKKSEQEELSLLAEEIQEQKRIEIMVPISHKVDNRARIQTLSQAVKNEYAARYLESIKVNVTPANIMKVHAAIPMNSCAVTRKRINLQEQYLCFVSFSKSKNVNC